MIKLLPSSLIKGSLIKFASGPYPKGAHFYYDSYGGPNGHYFGGKVAVLLNWKEFSTRGHNNLCENIIVFCDGQVYDLPNPANTWIKILK